MEEKLRALSSPNHAEWSKKKPLAPSNSVLGKSMGPMAVIIQTIKQSVSSVLVLYSVKN